MTIRIISRMKGLAVCIIQAASPLLFGHIKLENDFLTAFLIM